MIRVDWVACALMGAGLLGRQRPPWPYLRCRIDSGGLWPAVPGCRWGAHAFTAANPKISTTAATHSVR
jgi:hypothetical protein